MQPEPFVFTFEGDTIVAQRNADALRVKLSNEMIYKDPIRILHKDPLYLSFNKNETIIAGNVKIEEQKLITFKYNESMQQKMALKSNTIHSFLEPFLPRELEVVLDMIGCILNVLGLVLALKLMYDYFQRRHNLHNSSANALPWCRRPFEANNNNNNNKNHAGGGGGNSFR
jgi:hypothetical protein